MSDFFEDTNYEVPQKPSGYMKFTPGDNRIRILGTFLEGTAIKGYVYWITGKDGGRVPVRKRENEPIVTLELEDGEDSVRYFWSLPVYNYNLELVQILEITQRSVQKAITALAKDKDWGSPTGYDILINQTGQKLETRYTVQPKPAKPLAPEILKAYKDKNINIQALFKGEDPFKQAEEEEEEIEVGYGVNKSVEMNGN